MRQTFRQLLFALLVLSFILELTAIFTNEFTDRIKVLSGAGLALLLALIGIVWRGKVFTNSGNWRWVPNETVEDVESK